MESARPAVAITPGQTLDHFRLDALVGESTTGRTFPAINLLDGRTVAREESQTAGQRYHFSPDGGPGSDPGDVLPRSPAIGDRDTTDLSEQAGSRTTVTLTNPSRTGFSLLMHLD